MSDEPSWSTLDEIDQKIIGILSKNARTPSKEIASELRSSGVDVSDRTIRKRVERREKWNHKRLQGSSKWCIRNR